MGLGLGSPANPHLKIEMWGTRRSAQTLLEGIYPASIPKYGGFSAPQDDKTVLLRSK
jgi:hypothetical protein